MRATCISQPHTTRQPSAHRTVAQGAEAVVADLLRQHAVLTHAAHPELVLGDGAPCGNAGWQFPFPSAKEEENK